MRASLLAILVAVLATATACRSEHPTSTPTITSTATSTSTNPSSPTATPSASPQAAVPASAATITPVPAVVSEVLRDGGTQDLARLTPLLRYQAVACQANPKSGSGGPPRCQAGEADGTTSDYMLVAGCEGTWVRAAGVPDALRNALVKAHEPYAAALLEPEPNWPADVPYGKYVAVFGPSSGSTTPLDSLALYLDDTGIVRITIDCARPEQRIRGSSGQAFPLFVAPHTP